MRKSFGAKKNIWKNTAAAAHRDMEVEEITFFYWSISCWCCCW